MKKGNYLVDHLFSILGAVCLLISVVGSFLTYRTAKGSFVNPFNDEVIKVDNISVNIYDGCLNEMRVMAIIFVVVAILGAAFLLKRETGISIIFAIGAALLAIVFQLIISNTIINKYSAIVTNDTGKSYMLEESNKFKKTIADGDEIKVSYSFYVKSDAVASAPAEDAEGEEGSEEGGLVAKNSDKRICGTNEAKPVSLTVGDGQFDELSNAIKGKEFGPQTYFEFDYTVPKENCPKQLDKGIGMTGFVRCVVKKVKYSGEKLEVLYPVYLQAHDDKNSSDVVQEGKIGIGAILMMIGACLGAVCSVVALNRNE